MAGPAGPVLAPMYRWNFWNSSENTSYYIVVAFACSKRRGPSASRNCSVISNLLTAYFLFTFEKDVDVVKTDIIIRFSLMASELSPSIKFIV